MQACLPAACAATLLLAGCAGTHAVGYSLDPLGGEPVKIRTPVMVREIADRRPPDERFEPAEAKDFVFYSSDKVFTEPVAVSVTRMLQLELANSGVEVADQGNHLIGSKPHIRVYGDLLHFQVTCKEVPIDTLQYKVKTLWRRQQYSVRVSLHLHMVDGLTGKTVMSRVYNSSDSAPLRSEMIDVKAVQEEGVPLDKARWQVAGENSCVELLNDHLKRVLVEARNTIVKQLTP